MRLMKSALVGNAMERGVHVYDTKEAGLWLFIILEDGYSRPHVQWI